MMQDIERHADMLNDALKENGRNLFVVLEEYEKLKRTINAQIANSRYWEEEDKQDFNKAKDKIIEPLKKAVEIINKELKLLDDEELFLRDVLNKDKRTTDSILSSDFHVYLIGPYSPKIIIQEYDKNKTLVHDAVFYLKSIKEYLNEIKDHIEEDIKDFQDPNGPKNLSYEGVYNNTLNTKSIEEEIKVIIDHSLMMVNILKKEEKRAEYIEKCEKVTEKMTELRKRYSNKIEYGFIEERNRIVWNLDEDNVEWNLSVYMLFNPFHITDRPYHYSLKEGVFYRLDEEHVGSKRRMEETEDPKIVMRFYEQCFESIPKQRQEKLRKHINSFLEKHRESEAWEKVIEEIKRHKGADAYDVIRGYTYKEVESLLKELKCPPFSMTRILEMFDRQ